MAIRSRDPNARNAWCLCVRSIVSCILYSCILMCVKGLLILNGIFMRTFLLKVFFFLLAAIVCYWLYAAILIPHFSFSACHFIPTCFIFHKFLAGLIHLIRAQYSSPNFLFLALSCSFLSLSLSLALSCSLLLSHSLSLALSLSLSLYLPFTFAFSIRSTFSLDAFRYISSTFSVTIVCISRCHSSRNFLLQLYSRFLL